MGAPLTSANLDLLLLRMTAVKLAYAGLDSTTADGTNPDLGFPKVAAYRSLGLVPIGPLNLVDADLVGVADGQLNQLLDVAELATLEAILGNLSNVDQTTDTDNLQLHGKFYQALEATVARKRTQAQRAYGYGLGTLTPGVFDLGFAETIDQASQIPV